MVSPPDPPESRDAATEPSRSGSRRWSVRLVAGFAALYALLLLANAVLPTNAILPTTVARPSMVGAIRARAGVHGMPVWTAYTRCGAGKVVAGGFALYLDAVGDRQFIATWTYERVTGLDMAITVVSDVHPELDRFLSPGIMLRLGGS